MKYPAAISARYDETAGKIVIELEHHIELSFAPGAAQGLEGASASDLKALEITGGGTGLWFRQLDVDLSVSGLLHGRLGTRNWMAAGTNK